MEQWIGIDLDGTLAKYNGKGTGIGEPIPPIVDLMFHYLYNGIKVKLFTARAGIPKEVKAIREWLNKHNLPRLEITNAKDDGMLLLYDDRAKEVKFNQGIIVNQENLP